MKKSFGNSKDEIYLKEKRKAIIYTSIGNINLLEETLLKAKIYKIGKHEDAQSVEVALLNIDLNKMRATTMYIDGFVSEVSTIFFDDFNEPFIYLYKCWPFPPTKIYLKDFKKINTDE